MPVGVDRDCDRERVLAGDRAGERKLQPPQIRVPVDATEGSERFGETAPHGTSFASQLVFFKWGWKISLRRRVM